MSRRPLALALHTRLARLARLAALLGLVLLTCGCGSRRDEDVDRRTAWLNARTQANHLYLRDFLTRGADWYEFYDGWYATEQDPKIGSAWRWMDKRGVIRLWTKTGPEQIARDMKLQIFGWVPHDLVGLKSTRLEFSVNGHVLERFDPPSTPFDHTIFVPRWLLGPTNWVDFVISAANTGHADGDWRNLGFATTGFHWTPVGGS